ncbi:MAG: MerR family transcriptional regulator [Gammaproteobacteria bacterium]
MSTPMPDGILGLSPDMVRIPNDKGILPAMRTVNGHRLFKREDVEKLKAEREQGRGTRRARRRG